MGNISLNEALGRRESELLSSVVGSTIEISKLEFESGKDKDNNDFARVYISTTDGKTFRSSNKAILNQAKAMEKNLPKGSTVSVNVVQKKGEKGGYKYIAFEAI